MKLHVMTAVTRPANLNEIAESITVANARAPRVDLVWHRRYDLERQHVGGQHLKNQMLDDIHDGWVVILDDDTLMHPAFLQKISRAHSQHSSVVAIVVSQRRTTGAVLKAFPENAMLGKIDAGQAVLRRDFIGYERIPETYAGDGMWLQDLLYGRLDVHYLQTVLSLHNVLSGIDVSETPERMQA